MTVDRSISPISSSLRSMLIYPSTTYDDKLPERTLIPLLTLDEVKAILAHLRDTHNPPVRGTRVVSHHKIFPSLQEHTSGLTLHSLNEPEHSQSFDRKSTCDWLTVLISHLQKHLSKGGDDLEAHESLLDDAAALLSVFAGTASAGKLNRTFTFDHSLSPPVHVQVTDIPLENRDYTTLGAQTWGGAHVLAEIIVQNPHRFALHPEQYPLTPKQKILELGAGTGLVSLAIFRYLASRGLGATIRATDFNPLILDNLTHNISINKLAIPKPNTDLKISCGSLDWANPDAFDADLFNSVDLVLGADIIYEELHAHWIRTCLHKLMRRPRPGTIQPMFHLVIPLRPTHTFESNTIERIFPLTSETSGQHGWELVVFSKHSILCEASGDEADGRIEYAYYTIGWETRTPEL